MENMAGHLRNAQPFLQKRAVSNFGQADPEYGRLLQEELDKYNQSAVCTLLENALDEGVVSVVSVPRPHNVSRETQLILSSSVQVELDFSIQQAIF